MCAHRLRRFLCSLNFLRLPESLNMSSTWSMCSPGRTWVPMDPLNPTYGLWAKSPHVRGRIAALPPRRSDVLIRTMVDLLIELALERENNCHIEKFRNRRPGKGASPIPDRDESRWSKTPTNPNKGGGKGGGNLRAMNEVKPEAGVPLLFYCKPVNYKGGPCHAPDCEPRSGCMLPLKRQDQTKDGKTVHHKGSPQVHHQLWFLWQTPSLQGRMPHKNSARVTNSNTRRLSARKTILPPNPPRMVTRVLKGEGKGVTSTEHPTTIPRGARQRPLLLLLPPLLTLRSVRMEMTPPQRILNPRGGDRPALPNRCWLQGRT